MSTDRQKLHTEDEVYYVVAGPARFRSAANEIDVAACALLSSLAAKSTGSLTSSKT